MKEGTVNNEPMRGIDFTVQGIVKTGRGAYAVLIDEDSSLYFPVLCEPFQAELVGDILGGKLDICMDNYGIYFSFLSILKAHDIFASQLVFVIGKGGRATCCLELVEENELGSKVSRIPILLTDAVAISALGTIPIVVYGSAGSGFAFKIGREVPKQNIFSFVCEEIAKSERMSAIGSGDSDE